MSSWYEFEEDGTINRLVASSAEADECAKCCNGHKVGTAGARDAGHSRDQKRDVEGEAAANEVGSHGPECRSNDQARVLGDGQEGDALHIELVPDSWADDGDSLEPELNMINNQGKQRRSEKVKWNGKASCTYIIHKPSESRHGKYLPLERPHAKIDQGLVHDSNLSLIGCACAMGNGGSIDAMVVSFCDGPFAVRFRCSRSSCCFLRGGHISIGRWLLLRERKRK